MKSAERGTALAVEGFNTAARRNPEKKLAFFGRGGAAHMVSF